MKCCTDFHQDEVSCTFKIADFVLPPQAPSRPLDPENLREKQNVITPRPLGVVISKLDQTQKRSQEVSRRH